MRRAHERGGVAEGAEQVSPRLRSLFPSAPGSSLQRRVDHVAGDANRTAKTVNASEPAADPVLFRPRVALAGDWRLSRRELGLKSLGSGQKFTSESLEIVRHPAIRFGAGQAKVSFCPQAQICRVLHGGNSLMRGSVLDGTYPSFRWHARLFARQVAQSLSVGIHPSGCNIDPAGEHVYPT